MIVCRPYVQTRIFNLFIGTGMPILSAWILDRILGDAKYPHKLYYLFLLPILIGVGLYFLFFRCVWGLRCDEDKRSITFFKTFRKKTFAIRDIKELTVFRTSRGFDYRFKMTGYSITLEEMDNMPDLISYLKKVNPQLAIGSPEDHTYF